MHYAQEGDLSGATSSAEFHQSKQVVQLCEFLLIFAVTSVPHLLLQAVQHCVRLNVLKSLSSALQAYQWHAPVVYANLASRLFNTASCAGQAVQH